MLALTHQARAQDATGQIVKTPDEIRFSGLAGAVQTSVLYGDPTKPGLYVIRYKFPHGSRLQPHSHPDANRTVAVLSGTLYYAQGSVWDDARLKPFPAGTFFTELPGEPHFAWARDGEVVLQLTAIGPTATTFVSAPPR
jgi:quercetin dioxygenase-like cupin family protein